MPLTSRVSVKPAPASASSAALANPTTNMSPTATKSGKPATTTPIPPWVPLITSDNADVYPVHLSPPSSNSSSPDARAPELILNATSLADGYFAERPPYEFSSLRNDADCNDEDGVFVVDSTAFKKLIRVGRMLRGIGGEGRVVIEEFRNGEREEGAGVGVQGGKKGKGKKDDGGKSRRSAISGPTDGIGGPSSNAGTGGGKRLFPLQKPSNVKGLEDWMDRLASEEVDVAELARAVPLGPAIVRAVGKVLLMMFERKVPVQRATWYIRVAVLNECFKQIRPDRPVPSPRLFWTGKLSGFVKSEWELLRSHKAPRDKETLEKKMAFLIYVLRIARWQADEGLIDSANWIQKLEELFKSELMAKDSTKSSRAFLISAIEMSLLEILESSSATMALTRTITSFLERFSLTTVGSLVQEESSKAVAEKAPHAVLDLKNPQIRKILHILVTCLNSPALSDDVPLDDSSSADMVQKAVSSAKSLLAKIDGPLGTAAPPLSIAYPQTVRIDLALAAFHTHGDYTMIIPLLPSEPRAAALTVASWALKSCSRSPHVALTAASVLVKLSCIKNQSPDTSKVIFEQPLVKYKFHREIWFATKTYKHNPNNAPHISFLLAHFVSCSLVNVATLINDVTSLFHQVISDPDTAEVETDRVLLRHCAQYLFQLPKSYDKRTGDLMRALLRRLKAYYPDLPGMITARDAARKLPSLTSSLVAVAEAQEMSRTEPIGTILDTARRLREAFIEERSRGNSSESQFNFIPVIIFLLVAGCTGEAIRCLLCELGRPDNRPDEVCFVATSMASGITAFGAQKAIEGAMKYRKGRKKLRHKRLEQLRQALATGSRLSRTLLSDAEYRFTLGELIGDVMVPTLEYMPISDGSQALRERILVQVRSLLDSPDYHPFSVFLPAKRLAKLVYLSQISKLDTVVKDVFFYGGAKLGMQLGKITASRVFPSLSQSITAGRVADAEIMVGADLGEFRVKSSPGNIESKKDGELSFDIATAESLAGAWGEVLDKGNAENGSSLACVITRATDSPHRRMVLLEVFMKAGAQKLTGKDESAAIEEAQDLDSANHQSIPAWFRFVARFGRTVAQYLEQEVQGSESEHAAGFHIASRTALRSKLCAILLEKLRGQQLKDVEHEVANLSDIVGVLNVVLSCFAKNIELEEAKGIASVLGQITRSPAVIDSLYFAENTEGAQEGGSCLESITSSLRALKNCIRNKDWSLVVEEFLKQAADGVPIAGGYSNNLMTVSAQQRYRIKEVIGEQYLDTRDGHVLAESGVRERVQAYKREGLIDNWTLLEGIGKNPEEESALCPELFGMQEMRDAPDSPPPTRLKRTYSAFAYLVR